MHLFFTTMYELAQPQVLIVPSLTDGAGWTNQQHSGQQRVFQWLFRTSGSTGTVICRQPLQAFNSMDNFYVVIRFGAPTNLVKDISCVSLLLCICLWLKYWHKCVKKWLIDIKEDVLHGPGFINVLWQKTNVVCPFFLQFRKRLWLTYAMLCECAEKFPTLRLALAYLLILCIQIFINAGSGSQRALK